MSFDPTHGRHSTRLVLRSATFISHRFTHGVADFVPSLISRYLLNCLEKYRLGYDPRVIATIPKRPKKFRKCVHARQLDDYRTSKDIR